jgi:hypothetical protein
MRQQEPCEGLAPLPPNLYREALEVWKATLARLGRATWHIPLFGLLKFHSVSLCGRLYPLPRRSTFRFRNVLHLVEARNRVAHVRGVLQRLLALLGKSELGCRYPITSWFGQLCHCFPPSGASPCARTARDFLTRITAFPVPAAWCG